MTQSDLTRRRTISLIGEDWRNYHRPFLQQGFWALAFHRYGSWVRTIGFKPAYFPLRVVHLFLIKVSEIAFGISIGPNAQIGRRFRIEHFGCIIIHAEARIGNDVQIRQGVTIGNLDAGRFDAVPMIGDGVSIGAGAKILGPIKIGRGAVVGANAVVIRDVPEGALAVGVPAQIKFSSRLPDPTVSGV